MSQARATQDTGAEAEEVVHLFIDGRFVEAATDEVFETINPATEKPLARVALAQPEDVERAVAAARAAFDSGPWPRMSVQERVYYLTYMADLLEERAESLSETETRDTGLPIEVTRDGHIPRAVIHFRYFAEEVQRMAGEAYPSYDAFLSVTSREPAGVAGIITPWNAPLSVATMNVAAALACGNTCVLKPSEKAPLTASLLAEVAAEAELPEGVLNVIHGPGHPTGEALVAHPGVDVICFTGGTETGRRIIEKAAVGIRRVGCELGGKAANIIFADADFERALDGALVSIFWNNGENCVAGSRILVERPVYDRFLEAFAARARAIRVGDPLSPETEVGPLISAPHLENVLRYVRSGLEEGAVLLAGGDRPEHLPEGYYILPTVLADAHTGMRIVREEIFGPVAAVIPFETEEEAVRIANDTVYGLSSYVWSQNVERGLAVAARLRVGSVSVNAPIVRDIRVPFGGYKQSGLGRVGGRYSLDLFTEVKTTCLPVGPFPFPRMGTGE